jgi:hypothetical protein
MSPARRSTATPPDIPKELGQAAMILILHRVLGVDTFALWHRLDKESGFPSPIFLFDRGRVRVPGPNRERVHASLRSSYHR